MLNCQISLNWPKRYKAFVILDDAHGFGVLGNQGRGVCDHFGLTNEVDVICSSFSKSLAGSGGFVASDRDAIDYMRSHSKQTIFLQLYPRSLCIRKTSPSSIAG